MSESKITTSELQLQQRNTIFLLRAVCSTLFLGRAWQCFRWKTPISNILLDPNGLGQSLEGLYGKPLNEIYSDKLAEGLIVGTDYTLGVIFTICAFISLIIKKDPKVLSWLLYLGVAGLVLIYFAMIYSRNFYVGLFFEHSIQLLSPILLILTVRGINLKRVSLTMKVAVAITFACHGLFAIGYYPVPGYFVDLMIKGFGVTEPTAKTALVILGVLDFVFALLIFIPKTAKPALIYGVIWGFLTALARVWTTFDSDFIDNWFSQYLYEFLVRTGHFVLPLILYLIATDRIGHFPFRQRKTSG